MLGIAGVGYVGQRLLSRLNEPTLLLSRNPEKWVAKEQSGHHALKADFDDPDSLPSWIHRLDGMFYFAPPQPRGAEDQRLQHFLQWVSNLPPRRIVYISTSGVYGHCQGTWVDEAQPVNPGTDRARRRENAENQLHQFMAQHSTAVMILRVPGIYGPGRLPLERIRRGEPVICPDEAPYSNRIHVDDLVTCCLAVMDKGQAGSVYNVCDDQPSTMTDYLYAVADAAGIVRPPCVARSEAEGVVSPGMLSYLAESRRLVNRKMHDELKVELAYPTLVEGLQSIFNE